MIFMIFDSAIPPDCRMAPQYLFIHCSLLIHVAQVFHTASSNTLSPMQQKHWLELGAFAALNFLARVFGVTEDAADPNCEACEAPIAADPVSGAAPMALADAGKQLAPTSLDADPEALRCSVRLRLWPLCPLWLLAQLAQFPSGLATPEAEDYKEFSGILRK